jgi:hypothetical protein
MRIALGIAIGWIACCVAWMLFTAASGGAIW